MKISLRDKILFFILPIIVLTSALSAVGITCSYTADAEITDMNYSRIDEETVKVYWVTDWPTLGKVIFGTDKNDLKYFVAESREEPIKYHEVILGNLESDTEYYYRVVITDGAGEEASFLHKFETDGEEDDENEDKRPPRLTDFKLAFITGKTAVFTWETDEEATAVIEFGEDKLYRKKASDGKYRTLHRLIIKDLKPDMSYYARVYSQDKKKNSTGYYYAEFKTRPTDAIDRQNLTIAKLRPSSTSDSYLAPTYAIVHFETNHWAKGSVSLKGKDIKTSKVNLDYDAVHQAVFAGLTPGHEYVVSIAMADAYNKKITETYNIITPDISETDQRIILNVALNGSGSCLWEMKAKTGWFARYYLLDNTTPRINESDIPVGPSATGWYDGTRLRFSRIDENIKYGKNFYPFGQDSGNLFAVHWQAFFEVAKAGKYSFSLKSDDDSWLYLDNISKADLIGLRTKTKSKSIKADLAAGWHTADIYYSSRGNSAPFFEFSADKKIVFHPYPPDCSYLPGYNSSEAIDGNIEVAGISYEYYTPASAFYKTKTSPNIYAILKGQKHPISSPRSFVEYGYSWSDIKTVPPVTLGNYPRAKLIKTPDSNKIYFVYEKPGSRRYKVYLPSPLVFNSYPDNKWDKVVIVNQFDLDSIPEVKLIKTANNPAVYYLDNNLKRLITAKVWQERGFRSEDIFIINEKHLSIFSTSVPLD